MPRQKTPRAPRALVHALDRGVANYLDRRDCDAQHTLSGQLIALPSHGHVSLPTSSIATLLESLQRPLASAESDVWLRFNWRARHHRIRADIIALLLRARVPAALLHPALMGMLDEPWDANIHGVWVSGAQCRLRAQALRGLAHQARRETQEFSENDVTRIAGMLSMPGWLLAMRAAELLVALGPRAAHARSQLFQYGLVHHRWQVVEASARVILAIHGCYRSDDRLWARLLDHERWQVRGRVAQVLSHMPKSGASFGPHVLRRLEEVRENDAGLVRKYAQRALEAQATRAAGHSRCKPS